MNEKVKAWLITGAFVFGAAVVNAVASELADGHVDWGPVLAAAASTLAGLLAANPWKGLNGK